MKKKNNGNKMPETSKLIEIGSDGKFLDEVAVIDEYIKQVWETINSKGMGYILLELSSPRGDILRKPYGAFQVKAIDLIEFLEAAKIK